jgi:hypothetical protein
LFFEFGIRLLFQAKSVIIFISNAGESH